MSRTEILAKLRSLMADAIPLARAEGDEIDWQQVSEGDAIAKLGFDSLAMLDLLYDIQQTFEIELDPRELSQVTTVGHLVDAIAKHKQA